MKPQSAFSLVEVAISLGIVSFSLVAIVGLMGVGMQSNQEADFDMDAGQTAAKVLTHLRAQQDSLGTTQSVFPISDLDTAGLDSPSAQGSAFTENGNPQIAYITEEGATVTATDPDAVYRMEWRIGQDGDLRFVQLLLVQPPQAATDSPAAQTYSTGAYLLNR